MPDTDPIPEILWKYRNFNGEFATVIDRTEKLIQGKGLWFARFDTLNDPMEGNLRFGTYKNDFCSFLKIFSKVKTKGIASFSARNDNPLMWSHYADGLRGFAVGLKLKENISLKKIKYESSEKQSLGLILRKPKENITSEDIEEIFGVKGDCWEYEQEWRAFSDISSDSIGKISGEYEVREIVFGNKINPIHQRNLEFIIQERNKTAKKEIKMFKVLPVNFTGRHEIVTLMEFEEFEKKKISDLKK